MKRLVLWIAGLLVAFFLFALMSQTLGNGVVIPIAFTIVVVTFFLKYYNDRNKDD